MSANIAVIYSGDLRSVAEAFGEAAEHLGTRVRLRRVPGAENGDLSDATPEAGLGDLAWADGIAFGTPVGPGRPATELMRFVEGTEPLWSNGRLYDKVVTVITDEPEHFAADSVLHPIYDALYHWGAVIVGPRAFELALDAHAPHGPGASDELLSGARLRTAQYRGRRLAALANALTAERSRRDLFEM